MNISINFNGRKVLGALSMAGGLFLSLVSWQSYTEIEDARKSYNSYVELAAKKTDELSMNEKLQLAAVGFNEMMNPGTLASAKSQIESEGQRVNMLFLAATILNLLGIWLLRSKKNPALAPT